MLSPVDADEIELLSHLEAEYLQQCRDSFWEFCKQQNPEFYLEHRRYLRELCDKLQAFVEGRLFLPTGERATKLMINMPPRHGKTLTVENLTKWLFGHRPRLGTMAVSYSQDLSITFAKDVRDSISEVKVTPDRFVFADIFPGVRIKDGDSAAHKWSLDGSHFSFLATSPGGPMTGVGASLGLIDDLIKNEVEAFNEAVLEKHRRWYRNTYQSRLEAEAMEIVIATRWVTGDLCGWLQQCEPELWYVIEMPAWNEVASAMLAPDLLSRREFERRQENTDPVIFEGNYQQKPFDASDKLYPEFKTYTPDQLPVGGTIKSYTDTADEGVDYLASVVCLVHKNTAYVLDLLYTQAPMEETETATAKMLSQHRTQYAWIESNNGGRGFSRNVERIMRELFGFTACHVVSFHQSENKRARILTQATNVINSVFFPVGWENRWPNAFQHLRQMGRMSKWKRDDIADMLTGVVEKLLGKSEDHVVVVPLPVANVWSRNRR
jgi:predicted phage terminase large subunit-like protein